MNKPEMMLCFKHRKLRLQGTLEPRPHLLEPEVVAEVVLRVVPEAQEPTDLAEAEAVQEVAGVGLPSVTGAEMTMTRMNMRG